MGILGQIVQQTMELPGSWITNHPLAPQLGAETPVLGADR